MAVGTSFGRLGSGSFNFEQDYERAEMVFAGLRKRIGIGQTVSADIIVLPETIAGRLNRTGRELWKEEIQRLAGVETTFIFGAELPTGDGRKYDNALVMFRKDIFTVIPQRIPVPYSMYRGPFSDTGANLYFFENGILDLPDGRTATVIVCYEAFLTWPYLPSMFNKPDLIVCIANLWWCRETSLPRTMKRTVSLWALTFGVPVVFARNI
jgi:apolipoprotein N-acyltransferase